MPQAMVVGCAFQHQYGTRTDRDMEFGECRYEIVRRLIPGVQSSCQTIKVCMVLQQYMLNVEVYYATIVYLFQIEGRRTNKRNHVSCSKQRKKVEHVGCRVGDMLDFWW